MQTVFVSIGTNINAEANMLLVKESLNSLFDVIYSSIYKTSAEGFEGEDFLNSVCKFDTDKNPQELRTLLKNCLLYTSPSPRDKRQSRMPSSA